MRGTLEAVEVGGRFAFLAIRRGSGTSVSACVSAAGSPGGRTSILGFEIAIDRATDDGGELSIPLLDAAPLDVEPARAAGEAIGSRFTGIIERVDERFVYQRVNGGLVATGAKHLATTAPRSLSLPSAGANRSRSATNTTDRPSSGRLRIELDLPDF